MILDGGWISGTSASDVEAIRLRRSPRDVIKGLLAGLKNTVYLVTEGLYLTGDVQLDAYNRIYLKAVKTAAASKFGRLVSSIGPSARLPAALTATAKSPSGIAADCSIVIPPARATAGCG